MINKPISIHIGVIQKLEQWLEAIKREEESNGEHEIIRQKHIR